jgi:V/A-type H+-transporting ATPase subunit I
MIAPMKKFFLVVLDSDSRKAPHDLRRLGIAHVDNFESSGETCGHIEHKLRQVTMALSAISGRKPSETRVPPSFVEESPEVVARSIVEIAEAIQTGHDRIANLMKERDRIKEWGEFDPALLSELKHEGIDVRFFEGPAKYLDSTGFGNDFVKLMAPKGKARVAVVLKSDRLSSIPAISGFVEFLPGTISLFSIEKQLQTERDAIRDNEKILVDLIPYKKKLEAWKKDLGNELRLEQLVAGMNRKDVFRYLTGYVPASDVGRLKTEAARRGWALALDDPAPEDMPPTKIENPPAIRIIQPVFDFLGTVPHYREYDISGWFLVFFSLYFAMIFGDGAYGVILLVIGTFLALKSNSKKVPLPDAIKLLLVLGGMTTLWGLVTATWFAIPFNSLPKVLQALSVHALSSQNPEADTNVKIFCFIVGAIQIGLAHIKNIKRDFPDPKFLAQVGSLFLVIGMFNAVLNLVIDAQRFPLHSWALYLIAIGFGLVFVFGNWNGNLLKSMLDGLKGIIPTFLGTVSVFADIVSYIRLWAVGLAGLAISQTVNGMAMKMLGDPAGRLVAFIIGAFFSVILLLVGHSLNVVMSVLSVIVHGIRLNMLEFSGHLGMEWSGYKYDPLRETVRTSSGGLERQTSQFSGVKISGDSIEQENRV